VDVAVGARVGIRGIGGPACDGLGDGPERLCGRLGCGGGQRAGGVRQEGASGRRVRCGGGRQTRRWRCRRRTAGCRVYSVLV